ncbi:MAG: hypothetical protein E7419_03945 [Ruminococcaceae bacterium]|nr:hypothetical protein [Oscillospiraceae bacterium]
MKKYIGVFLMMYLTFLLCSCASNYQHTDKASAKAIDGVPDDVIYEFVDNKYNSYQYLYKKNPGRSSKPVFNNAINIYQRVDTMVDVDNFIVNLKVKISGEISTKEVELQCECQLSDGTWYVRDTNEIVRNIEWHYSNLTNCWWTGGAGLAYRAFRITNVNTQSQSMNIIDQANREYSTNYEVFDDYIEIKIKYDTINWFIFSEGPMINGYFMRKEN